MTGLHWHGLRKQTYHSPPVRALRNATRLGRPNMEVDLSLHGRRGRGSPPTTHQGGLAQKSEEGTVTRLLREHDKLKWLRLPGADYNTLCDTSTGTHRVYLPTALRQFTVAGYHGISYPGARATMNLKQLDPQTMVLLGPRTALRTDSDTRAAQLLYGQNIALPGEFFTTPPEQVDTHGYAASLRKQMTQIHPAQPDLARGRPFVPKQLATPSHVFLRCTGRPHERDPPVAKATTWAPQTDTATIATTTPPASSSAINDIAVTISSDTVSVDTVSVDTVSTDTVPANTISTDTIHSNTPTAIIVPTITPTTITAPTVQTTSRTHHRHRQQPHGTAG
ncbi:hypothetical protein AAG570_013225 [Ranatra chinensis]|uniref:Uncharacterized protein n=1 Tax=Ranatra chinensis TaxID=642074 RepID=A0ABD0YSL5_9HEMI